MRNRQQSRLNYLRAQCMCTQFCILHSIWYDVRANCCETDKIGEKMFTRSQRRLLRFSLLLLLLMSMSSLSSSSSSTSSIHWIKYKSFYLLSLLCSIVCFLLFFLAASPFAILNVHFSYKSCSHALCLMHSIISLSADGFGRCLRKNLFDLNWVHEASAHLCVIQLTIWYFVCHKRECSWYAFYQQYLYLNILFWCIWCKCGATVRSTF